jgi:hypothetical protein
MPATDLAATSFTGLGKLRIDFIEIDLIANYLTIFINHHPAAVLKLLSTLHRQPKRLIRQVRQRPVRDTVGYV